MDYIELKDMLGSQSPFILRQHIEQEEHLYFNGDQLVLNEKTLGKYLIEEKENYYCIMCLDDSFHLPEPLLVCLTYREKPVVLVCKEKYRTYDLKLDVLDTLPQFIPQEQFLDDEKAEL